MSDTQQKDAVRAFWNEKSCGEVYAVGSDERASYEAQRDERYRLEPYLAGFARFADGRDKDVLEIGVGMGADHVEWAKHAPRSLAGIDLTPRAVEHTLRRLSLYGFASNVRVGDAEALPFADGSFDLVFSYGVLHHSPDTPRAIAEAARVLRPGGMARIMIYHKYSLVGYMLWLRYALLAGRPFRSLRDVYAHHLESPGTKAYSVAEARAMLGGFSRATVTTRLTFSDLLEGSSGQRHGGIVLRLAKRLWPRWLLRRVARNHGLLLFIDAVK
jgi:SAM-dependent methyltransferase